MFIVYSKESCPFCVKAIDALNTMNEPYVKYDIEKDERANSFFKENEFQTVPQVFDGAKHVGGYEELADYLLELT